MTREQKINLRNALTANLEGRPVQAKSISEELYDAANPSFSEEWYDVENPSFASDYEWREKPNETSKIS